MRLGVNCGFWGAGADEDNLALVQAADRLGYDVFWASEAYGPDVATVLAWVGARTSRIGLGAGVMQIPGRTPAMTAMTAASLDHLSGGRFRLGLGVSGPQVSEGWHGVPFGKPLGRTREYVDVVRMALSRKPVAYDGQHLTLPLPDGPGKSLRLAVAREEHAVPIYLAAVGPKNCELAGEIGDGWLGVFVAPDHLREQLDSIATGRARAETDGQDAPFDVTATVPVAVGEDVAACAALVAPYAALYVGGMGSREHNFYNQLAARMGFEQEAAHVQDLYLAGQHREAAAAVPVEFIDATSLLGPPARIATRMQRYADAGVTTLTATPWGVDLPARSRSLEVAHQAWEQLS